MSIHSKLFLKTEKWKIKNSFHLGQKGKQKEKKSNKIIEQEYYVGV